MAERKLAIHDPRLSRLNWSPGRGHRCLVLLERRNSAHAGVNPVQRVGMKRNCEKVSEIKHDERVNRIQPHAYQKRPLLAFARKIPEDYEHARNESIDDQVERESRLSDRKSTRLNSSH